MLKLLILLLAVLTVRLDAQTLIREDQLKLRSLLIDPTDTTPTASTGRLWVKTDGSLLKYNGSSWDTLGSSTGISGSGTSGYLPKFTASSTLGDSKILEDANNITATDDFYPSADATYGLGKSSLRWGAIFANSITLSNDIGSSTGLLTVAPSMRPSTDDTRSLGEAGLRWKDGHFSGTSYLGSAAITTTFKLPVSAGAASNAGNLKVNTTTGSDKLAYKNDNGTAKLLLDYAPAGTASNLIIESITNTSTIQIGAGATVVLTGPLGNVTASNTGVGRNAITVNVNSNITVDLIGTGAGHLDTGTRAVSTWYYVWLAFDSANNTLSGFLSTSPSAPSFGGTYDYAARIGAVKTDATAGPPAGAIIAYIQVGRHVRYSSVLGSGAPAAIVEGTAAVFTDVSAATLVPPFSRIADLIVTAVCTGSTNAYTQVRAKGTSGSAYSAYAYQVVASGKNFQDVMCALDSTQTLQYLFAGGSGTNNAQVFVSGYWW